MKNLCAILLLTFLVSCMSVNKTAEISIDSILALSAQIDTYERRGWITNETEDELQNSLIDALNVLNSTYTIGDVAGCTEEMSQQECIQVILTEVERRLTEAENGD